MQNRERCAFSKKNIKKIKIQIQICKFSNSNVLMTALGVFENAESNAIDSIEVIAANIIEIFASIA